MVYRREFYQDSALEPKNSLMFAITFVPFGKATTPSLLNQWLKLKKYFSIYKKNFFNFIPKSNSTIIFNPPYDVRLSVNKNLDDYYAKIGKSLRKNCQNSTIHIFTIKNQSLELIELPCLKSQEFKNGNLDCILNTYQI